jgi:hypothetical protein
MVSKTNLVLPHLIDTVASIASNSLPEFSVGPSDRLDAQLGHRIHLQDVLKELQCSSLTLRGYSDMSSSGEGSSDLFLSPFLIWVRSVSVCMFFVSV